MAQVDQEMVWIKEHDHHWEDGIEVSSLRPTLVLCSTPLPHRMHFSPSQSLKPNDTLNGSPHQNHLNHHHRSPTCWIRTLLLQIGALSAYVVATAVCYVWTIAPIAGLHLVTSCCITLGVLQAPWLRIQRCPRKNHLLTKRFHGASAIAGYSMLMTNPQLDLMALMRRIESLWMNFTVSALSVGMS
jgi:hypothetical protein